MFVLFYSSINIQILGATTYLKQSKELLGETMLPFFPHDTREVSVDKIG